MRSLLFAGLVALAAFDIGCSSSASNTSASSNGEVSSNQSTVNAANSSPYTPASGNTGDANMANPANPAVAANANQSQVKVITPQGNAKPLTFPAPDNSEYSSSMNSTGQAVETRTFHSDPVIAKVERIWKDVNDKTVTIYLKNGKTVKVPADKVPEIKSLPVQSFYDLAGVKPAQPASKGTPAPRKDAKQNQ